MFAVWAVWKLSHLQDTMCVCAWIVVGVVGNKTTKHVAVKWVFVELPVERDEKFKSKERERAWRY